MSSASAGLRFSWTTAETAAITGTRNGWVEFALLAAVSIALGFAATRYLNRPAAS